MIAWLNLGSLVFGIVAWTLPVIFITRDYKLSSHWTSLSIVSISVCSISLFFHICSFYERVKDEDWSALMDTVSIIAPIPAIFLFGTIILNAIALYIYRDRTVW